MYIKGGIRLTNNDNVTTHKKKAKLPGSSNGPPQMGKEKVFQSHHFAGANWDKLRGGETLKVKNLFGIL